MGNIVAIVGRPNVGKSTLFNRLTGTRKAIVNETAGVTRDRNYGKADWNGTEFSLIDTGGFSVNSDDIFEEEIRKQVMLAIDESDAILFVLDVQHGLTDFDQAVAKILRRTKKKVYVVANKADNSELIYAANEFYSLGIGDLVYPISSVNGSGTGDMLDALVADFIEKPEEDDMDLPRIAFVGRPNVGKSSTVNALLGVDRNIVTDVAGTTRDSIHTRFQGFGHDFIMVDTAGVRKKPKVNEDLEFYSVMRSIRTIESADVCVLILDATRGVEAQDLAIYDMVIKNRKGCVVMVNKWDLLSKETNTMKEFEADIRKRLAPFNDVPIVFTSAVEKVRLIKVLENAITVYENRVRKIKTSELNKVMLKAIENFRPPAVKGKFIQIKYVSQLPTFAPTFAFYCNLPQYIRDSYKRYLENQIRDNWDFTGVPIQIFVRKK
ncbi:ribosome biogenesis GTPase Der [Ancylomarina sp. DW003]|uniref:GTPase Der n=1 Tax=Paralabilibaculum antarcticum TaxID=2912572 RepID=A0ABT5VY69_9BACT|nr:MULTISPECIES: ribosome biogenesis GTPase Der [Marinifilaceae]MDE5420355.1 ribosome biogenesis GTPase Der [Labilibaculum sp. DW002]MDE5423844.1 ribosome biogenesis GTPase Der [Ancylomarina sp. DW003]